MIGFALFVEKGKKCLRYMSKSKDKLESYKKYSKKLSSFYMKTYKFYVKFTHKEKLTLDVYSDII